MPQAPYVLIFAPPNDGHARIVYDEISRQKRCAPIFVELDRYPDAMQSRMRVGSGDLELVFEDGATRISAGDVRSFWWRRPSQPSPSAAISDPKVQRYVRKECRSVCDSFLSLLDCRKVNNPDAERPAENKPFQLAVARQVGLEVPETLITNDPEAARAFCTESSRVIYKQLTNFGQRLVDTRLVDDEVLDHLDLARLAPVIFQEFVEGRDHLRVNVIGERVFAARLYSDHPGAHVDWRLDPLVKIEDSRLDDGLEAKVLDFMRRLGLRFGAIDFRLRKDGSPVFLELNVSGQFLFVEDDTRQPLLDAFVEELTGE
ncbi:MAG: MvdC/MvdD family ATP grasp protein [Actinomycetota bacterium]